ncbi:MAG: outer membrane beta-barrel protein [Bacteroidota bacterium]
MTTRTDFIKTLLLLSFFTFFYTDSFAQLNRRGGQLAIRAGITTGSPIVFKNIPEGATGRPGVGLNAGLEYTYAFHPRFSMTIGAAYAQKGSSFTSPVSGKYDATRGVFGERFPFPLRVKYTGNVAAGFDMTYLDFPILANVHLKKWRIGLGYQYSKMLEGTLDGSVDVKALLLKFNDQEFDESENMKDYDHAAMLKISRQVTKRFSIATDFTFSGQPLLIEAEEGFNNPRNVFVNVLLGFRLF